MDDIKHLKQQARRAGLLYTLVALTAPISLQYVPSQLLDIHDAAATANRIASQALLLRLGIACELFHQAVEVYLVLVLYQLFKPVNESLARQMAVLGLIPIPIVFLNVLNEVAALMLASGAGYLQVIAKPQLDALVLLFMRLHGYGLQIAAVYWGLWLIPLGLLVWRCGFMPRILAPLVMASGLGYLLGAVTSLVIPDWAPALATPIVLLELGEPVLILWLLIFGARLRLVLHEVEARADGRERSGP